MYICTYVNVRIYVCIHVYMYVYIYTRMCVCVFTCVYMYTCMWIYTHVYMYVETHLSHIWETTHSYVWHGWRFYVARQHLQCDEDPYDALSLIVIFHKRELWLVALLKKATSILRHPMHFRHPKYRTPNYNTLIR